jgi:glycosyltransferase involved in cell wall biosynthesis
VKYTGLDYGAAVDTAAQIAHVTTVLKYGDLSAIKNPWLTVLIPTFRRVDLLKEAISSVLNQYHCDFLWDIVVLDNEEDDGEQNDTEKLIRIIDSQRILYYRNSEHIRPGDNFNRAMQIARGKWVCFLHDDDLLVGNTLQKMERLISVFSKRPGKPLGAISAKYHQFIYDSDTRKCNINIEQVNKYYCDMPLYYGLYQLTHANLWFTANIGGDVPSNGAIFNREAALECGGFIEDFGISGDLILYYRMEKNYRVYSTVQPMGLYRWGNNTMVRPESTRRVIKDGFDFREYVYSQNFFTRCLGTVLRTCHYKLFTVQVIAAKNKSVDKEKQIKREDFCKDHVPEPPVWLYAFYRLIFQKLYFRHKYHQSKRFEKFANKMLLQECESL